MRVVDAVVGRKLLGAASCVSFCVKGAEPFDLWSMARCDKSKGVGT